MVSPSSLAALGTASTLVARQHSHDHSPENFSSVINMESMFEQARNFNSDISNWDISSVDNMDAMFRDADEFNQDLCAWGDKFPYNNARGIFSGSGCTFQDTPQESQQGPFCASSCD